MDLRDRPIAPSSYDWLCPDLTAYWKLWHKRDSEDVVLQATQGTRRLLFSLSEGYALSYFTGQFTVGQVQNLLKQKFGDAIAPTFVVELLQKLVALEILADTTAGSSPLEAATTSFRLKPTVQWIKHPDGYWILRNPEDVTFLQVARSDKAIIDQLSQRPLAEVAQEFCLRPNELKHLLQLLAYGGMLEGTKPPKPPSSKFNPLHLLFFKIPLFNPDPWLTRHVNKLRWLWTRLVAFLLCFFLAWSLAIGIKGSSEIFFTGQQMWARGGASLILPFVLLMMLVVSLHELGHAFALKHYGGIVPEIGLLFMCLMPGCYTNTSDSYCLVKRRQRALVVGAGVVVQLVIWAIALWLWHLSNPDTWLHTTSYLLMVTALFTVAVNLNPLSKFDGYYLAVALSGINNLRSRSFQFYSQLLRPGLSQERGRDALILAAYAPLSLVYSLLVFGHLWLWVTDWSLTQIPATALLLLGLWAIYFCLPTPAIGQQSQER